MTHAEQPAVRADASIGPYKWTVAFVVDNKDSLWRVTVWLFLMKHCEIVNAQVI